MSLDVKEMVQKENMKNAECILCGECVDTCPKKAIGYSMKRRRTKKKPAEDQNDG